MREVVILFVYGHRDLDHHRKNVSFKKIAEVLEHHIHVCPY